jgi:hypothetical protein
VSYYGILLPEYWDGDTGVQIQERGGANATLLGAFLMANRRANMIGLYRLPLREVLLPLTRDEVIASLSVLDEVQFAHYDVLSAYVWVREMARIRVGLKSRTQKLDSDDNRVLHINRLYTECEDNPFLGAFFERYAKILHLKKKRTTEHHPNISPLERASGGPPKPVNRSDQDQVQIRKSTGASRRDSDEGSWKLYCVVATEALEASRRIDHDETIPNVVEHFKTLCARRHLTYSTDIVARAVEAAIAADRRKAAS